jgi:hypothetical protein
LLPTILGTGILLVLAHAILWGMTFTIDDLHVRVRVYGRSVRKVALSDIEWAAPDWALVNEHWTNTINPRRIVLLRRRTGIMKNFLISPLSREDFLNDLAAYGVTIRSAKPQRNPTQ